MALDLSGASDRFENMSIGTTITGEPFTLACWANDRDNSARSALLAFGQDANNNVSIQVETDGDCRLAYRASTGNTEAITTITSTQGNWHHFAGVCASTTSRTAYLNGGNAVEDTTSVTFFGGSHTVDIGSNLGVETSTIYVAECGIWNVALNADEIAALALGYSPLMIRPHALVVYVPGVIFPLFLNDYITGGQFTPQGSPTKTVHPVVINPAPLPFFPTGITPPPSVGDYAYGEESPSGGEIPVSWLKWSNGAGGSPVIIGDLDWGNLNLNSGDVAHGPVINYQNSDSREYTITNNVYGTGSGTVIIEIRGSASSSFSQDAATPTWTTYSGPTTQSWQWVQMRIRKT